MLRGQIWLNHGGGNGKKSFEKPSKGKYSNVVLAAPIVRDYWIMISLIK